MTFCDNQSIGNCKNCWKKHFLYLYCTLFDNKVLFVHQQKVSKFILDLFYCGVINLLDFDNNFCGSLAGGFRVASRMRRLLCTYRA